MGKGHIISVCGVEKRSATGCLFYSRFETGTDAEFGRHGGRAINRYKGMCSDCPLDDRPLNDKSFYSVSEGLFAIVATKVFLQRPQR